MGLSARWYEDLEAYPDDVVSTVSLAELQVLGRTLGLEPATILVGESTLHRRNAESFATSWRASNAEWGRRASMQTLSVSASAGKSAERSQIPRSVELQRHRVTGRLPGVGVDWLAVLPRLK